ncbi:hypothetical protein CVT25_008093 [Psilocybe cyanescens]|uniref:Uncharacterized protein n=1 Tax=Psilocybe cyanescens TaxID=93625 RepID=A0A409X6S1_PSICY|nr:hypothetical protein CVT25_008093 [Psilocybe cyanescens]
MHTDLMFFGIHFVISKYTPPDRPSCPKSHDRNVPTMFPNNAFGLASNNTSSMSSTSFETLLRIKVNETKMSRLDSASAGTTSTGREAPDDR